MVLRGPGRSLATIFLPLTWQVWVLHVAIMCFGGAVILFIEATAAYVRAPGCGGGHEDEGDEEGEPVELSLDGLLKSIYAALIHFLWNGPKHEPRTHLGRIALFALSFHTLVIAASYTASLAGFLATPVSVPLVVLSFKSIQTSPLTSLEGRLCVLQSAEVAALRHGSRPICPCLVFDGQEQGNKTEAPA